MGTRPAQAPLTGAVRENRGFAKFAILPARIPVSRHPKEFPVATLARWDNWAHDDYL